MNQRRQFLTALGTSGVTVFTGCTSSGEDGTETGTPPTNTSPPADGSQTPTTPTTTLTPTQTQTPTDSAPPTEQTSQVTATDRDPEDSFGTGVALSDDGTTAIIGALNDEDPNGREAGSAYVFEKVDDSWNQQTKLIPDDGNRSDEFGFSVAVSADGTTAIVGARRDDDPNGWGAGSAYIFEETEGSWNQQAKLSPDDDDNDDDRMHFGAGVELDAGGTTALIAAPQDENQNGWRAGAAYIFEESGGSWNEQDKLIAEDGVYGARVGSSVALSNDGTTAIIGAIEAIRQEDVYGGVAYIFAESGGSWNQQDTFIPDDGDLDIDYFGWSIALSADGTTAIIGKPSDDDPNCTNSGSAYVFESVGDSWSQRAKLVPNNGEAFDDFGFAVAVSSDGTTACIGAPNETEVLGREPGSAYIFEKSQGSWDQYAEFALDDEHNNTFGSAMALSADGTTALIGASEGKELGEWNFGSVYVFE